jgi:hypothetical protein
MTQISSCVRSLTALSAIRRLALVVGALAIPQFVQAQVQSGPAQCAVYGTPRQVRAEGVAERVGDIVLQCSFGNSPTTLSSSLTVYLTAAVTNPVDGNGVARDAVLLADSGGGFAPTGVSNTVAGSSLTFHGINLPVPAGGYLSLKISGIRVNASQVGGAQQQPIYASVAINVPVSQSPRSTARGSPAWVRPCPLTSA